MNRLIALSFIVVLAVPADHVSSQTIKKCQDATGKWHYGDIAADECARSRVTEIDDRGLKVDVHEAPATRDELEAARAAEITRQEEDIRAEEQRRRENHLLSIYDSEQSIIRARDERLASLEKMLKSDEKFKSKLQENLSELQKLAAQASADEGLRRDIESLHAQVREYDEAIDSRLRQRELIIGRYNGDLNRYREIVKRRQAP